MLYFHEWSLNVLILLHHALRTMVAGPTSSAKSSYD